MDGSKIDVEKIAVNNSQNIFVCTADYRYIGHENVMTISVLLRLP